MGLTVNYKIAFKGTAEELCNKLEIIRQKCRDLPFEEVSDIEHIRYSKEDIAFFNMLQDECSYPNNTEENLAKRDKALKDKGLDINTMINLVVSHSGRAAYYQMVNCLMWPGEGCESVDLNFVKKRDYWRCEGFCKTQYATHFARCHLLVISVLDMLKALDFIVDVDDEGEYWESRDIKVLGKNINEYTAMLTSIGKSLRGIVEKMGGELVAPIETSQNYMKVDNGEGEKEVKPPF